MKRPMVTRLESALPAGADPRQHARLLSRVWETSLAGKKSPVAVRPIISDSWQRVRRTGLDPDCGREPPAASPPEEIEHLREKSGLTPALQVLRAGLTSIADDGVHIMVVTGPDGRILWREGSRAVRLRAEDMGFVEGALWNEATVGTNGIGTGLAVERPIQVFAAEHFARTHHPWVCTAAPLYDPVDGRVLGLVDVSGPAATVHPSTLALVYSVSQLATRSLREAHDSTLNRLRCVAASVLASTPGPAVVTDRNGRVAASKEIWVGDRVLLPDRLDGEAKHIPSIGWCRVEPLFEGWLIHVNPREPDRPTKVRLHLTDEVPAVEVIAPSGAWRYRLRPRHAEILLLLALSRTGRTAAELSADLFGSTSHVVAVRAEMSRLRSQLGSLIEQRPYRFSSFLTIDCLMPDDLAMLLPQSTAPAVRVLRTGGPARWN